MRTAGAAIGWEFRRRHRWGLLGVAACLLVTAAVRIAVAARGRDFIFGSSETFAISVAVPITTMCTYFMAVFTYGLAGDVAARESMYPRRMLALPVSTGALAGWPMAWGALTITLFWIVTRPLLLWPPSLPAPVVWPGLVAVVLLCWAQALTWLPYGVRGARVVVAMLWLSAVDTIVLLQLHVKASELALAAFLAPQVPLAYLVARYAVARARRGDVPDWTARLAGLGASGARRSTTRVTAMHPAPAFRSAQRAQAWFEWRQHGRTLPALVAMALPFELLLLWAVGESAGLVFVILAFVLLTPAFLAVFAGASTATRSSDARGAPAFTLTRPVSGEGLIAAKLAVAVRSTLAAWALVILAVPVALAWSGAWPLAARGVGNLSATIGAPRAMACLLLAVASCVAASWRQLVQSLCIGLTGRERLIKGAVFTAIVMVSILLLAAAWIVEERLVGRVWTALPLILAGLAALKMTAGTWIVVRLHRGQVVGDRLLMTGAAAWSTAVFALYATLRWLADTPHIPAYLLLLIAILGVPLARLSAAPLAIAWSRHQ